MSRTQPTRASKQKAAEFISKYYAEGHDDDDITDPTYTLVDDVLDAWTAAPVASVAAPTTSTPPTAPIALRLMPSDEEVAKAQRTVDFVVRYVLDANVPIEAVRLQWTELFSRVCKSTAAWQHLEAFEAMVAAQSDPDRTRIATHLLYPLQRAKVTFTKPAHY